MKELDEKTLKKLQRVELELLIEFDRICRKNNIKYSITGGTLLGAVRHGGFIPWDDDADVSMLREEYEKFVAVCHDDLDGDRFYFQDIDHTEGYRWGYAKLRRKDSLFLRENQEHMPYEQGIFLDIFPRDSVPDQWLLERVHKFRCFVVRKVLWSEVGRYSENNPIKRKIYSFIRVVTSSKEKNIYHSLLKTSRNNKTKRVRALTFPVPNNEKGYLREWYSAYEDISFENYPLMVESGYLEWLKQEFHNYMELPPVDKRKCHSVVEIKFPEGV